jgi:hypothetical protein
VTLDFHEASLGWDMKKLKGNNFLKERIKVEKEEMNLPFFQGSLYSCL